MRPSREMCKDQSVTRSEDSMPGRNPRLKEKQFIPIDINGEHPAARKTAYHAPTEDFAIRSLQYAILVMSDPTIYASTPEQCIPP